MMMIMTVYRVWIWKLQHIALERPQSSGWFFFFFFGGLCQVIVHAGYVFVAIIHRTLTWTTFIMHTDNAFDGTQGCMDTEGESAWKLNLGRKSFAAPCTVAVMQWDIFDTEIKGPFAENPQLSKVPLMPGIG